MSSASQLTFNFLLEKEYMAMDETSKNHLIKFEKIIEEYLIRYDRLLKDTIECLEGEGDYSCSKAKYGAEHMLKPIRHDSQPSLIGEFDTNNNEEHYAS